MIVYINLTSPNQPVGHRPEFPVTQPPRSNEEVFLKTHQKLFLKVFWYTTGTVVFRCLLLIRSIWRIVMKILIWIHRKLTIEPTISCYVEMEKLFPWSLINKMDSQSFYGLYVSGTAEQWINIGPTVNASKQNFTPWRENHFVNNFSKSKTFFYNHCRLS